MAASDRTPRTDAAAGQLFPEHPRRQHRLPSAGLAPIVSDVHAPARAVRHSRLDGGARPHPVLGGHPPLPSQVQRSAGRPALAEPAWTRFLGGLQRVLARPCRLAVPTEGRRLGRLDPRPAARPRPLPRQPDVFSMAGAGTAHPGRDRWIDPRHLDGSAAGPAVGWIGPHIPAPSQHLGQQFDQSPLGDAAVPQSRFQSQQRAVSRPDLWRRLAQ